MPAFPGSPRSEMRTAEEAIGTHLTNTEACFKFSCCISGMGGWCFPEDAPSLLIAEGSLHELGLSVV